jgi:putative membrane protein
MRGGNMMDDRPDPPHDNEPTNPNLTRDHLANERTLLAWLRTGIAVAGIGILVARFGLEQTGAPGSTDRGVLSEVVGIALIAAGAGLTLLGAYRYRRTTDAINADVTPPVGRLDLWLTGGFLAVCALLILAVLVSD